MNSKQKGNRGERELAKVLQEYGYTTRRGHQFNGQTDEADVVGVPGLHIEVKRVEKLNLELAMSQSARDAREGEIPVVVHRKNGRPWLITMQLADYMPKHKKAEIFDRAKGVIE